MSATPRSEFVYVTYIRTTPQRLWAALTEDTEFMKQYWFGTRTAQLLPPRGGMSESGRRAISCPRPLP